MSAGRLLFACALLASACAPESPGPGYNVILITLDTVRADYLGCYGYPGEITPTLDRLADEGARFDFCIATAGLTPVSHASILTGLNQYDHELRVMDAGTAFSLPENVPTLASILGAAGWTTGAFLSGFPVSRHFFPHIGFETFYDDGLEVEMELMDDGNRRWNGDAQRSSEATTDAAIDWLADVRQPFLMWLHYWDPHDDRLLPPREIFDRFVTADGQQDRRERYKQIYAAEIHAVDRQIGRLLEALRQRGIYEDTIIVVTADHGEGLWEHGWRDHKILYQEQLHVPLIARLPLGPAQTTVDDLVRTIDIVPTILKALDVPAPAMEGLPLQGLMAGRGEAPRLAYADALNKYDLNARLQKSRPQDLLLYAMMDRRWKLIFRPDDPAASELYDLLQDPEEAHNLYHEERGHAARLVRLLEARGPFERVGFGDSRSPPEVLQALAETGYVDDDEE